MGLGLPNKQYKLLLTLTWPDQETRKAEFRNFNPYTGQLIIQFPDESEEYAFEGRGGFYYEINNSQVPVCIDISGPEPLAVS